MQILAWGSTQYDGIGADLEPLRYTWSDQLDFEFWTPGVISRDTDNISQAGTIAPTNEK